jgi:threonine synthase
MNGIFDYARGLPEVPPASRVTLGEGGTPLVSLPAAGAAIGVPRLSGKDEARNPTGTFKDRCMALCASIAVTEGAGGLICASTGNAGASAAAYAARAGLPAVILVPVGTPAAKMAQAAVCGATVVAVEGSYSDAWRLAAEVAEPAGWLNATTTFVCPYVVEGTRTVAYELEAAGSAPDWVVVPIGAGPLLVGIHRGFADVQRTPRLLAVQPAGCAPIVRAFERGMAVEPWTGPATVASGLADPLAGYPEEGEITLQAVRASGGAAIAVDDDATIAAVRRLAESEGLFQEPSGAIALAGAAEARSRGIIGAADDVVLCLTGTGLKDPRAALQADAGYPTVASAGDLEELLTRAPRRRP